ncbi:hypothetical protein Pse7367_3542 [Thalassoporum mexicanum PCC 7367]|uniref:hypothetical protein n=1 Tax=Thalassoporum mexicanum TaxID=3457544 RepID=UPI00029FA3CE|nr:hypothetical protein [Pseudanabaena sp. PCC 7367]AFY71777.1 hypothetical protein Pse7367_3542 [Pseudanabaena sp. PCC 7367]
MSETKAAIVPFTDNWAYLKTELAWLDRILRRVLAKQRKLNHEVNRVANSPADRATSHWWQGFINLDQNPANGGSHQKQERPIIAVKPHPIGRFGDRIAASFEQDIQLSVPLLCQQLELSEFERNIIILCLAPEINRRYEKLYAYLNNDETNSRQPTVDLALRLFCRNDAEWQIARQTLQTKATLLKNKILEIQPSTSSARTLLARHLLLTDKAVDYCLSDRLSLIDVLPKKRGRKRRKTLKITPKQVLNVAKEEGGKKKTSPTTSKSKKASKSNKSE